VNPPKKQRVAIVTGASRGLGKELALCFGKRGDKVVVNFLSREEDAVCIVEEIRGMGGEAVLFRADVRNGSDVEKMTNDMVERWGRVDILVNNAGMTRDGILLRMTEQDWDDVIATNLTGPFHCVRAVSRIMTKQREGHIINISSIVGIQGREGQANYSASKAGLIGFTKACARELGQYNIKVNTILPGFIQTEMGDKISDVVFDRILRENALARVSDPNEVADFVYHLSSMNNVSGQIFNLDSRTF
jgi:3-oxoacyl-[acyl-carrier protein] reductase